MALVVHPTMNYVKIRDTESGEQFILLASRVVELYPPTKKAKKDAKPAYEVLETLVGTALVGMTYEPLFDYYKERCATLVFVIFSSSQFSQRAATKRPASASSPTPTSATTPAQVSNCPLSISSRSPLTASVCLDLQQASFIVRRPLARTTIASRWPTASSPKTAVRLETLS